MKGSSKARCISCGAWHILNYAERINRLRAIGMLRQEAKPDPAVVDELFRTASDRLTCPACGAPGLSIEEVDQRAEDELWGMPRRCAECNAPIPRERLEMFPDAHLCVLCQSRDERGETTPDATDYCPRCGALMKATLSRGAGISRYVLSCTDCGRR
jgi:RNA polymerase-binding transcription factor DksA